MENNILERLTRFIAGRPKQAEGSYSRRGLRTHLNGEGGGSRHDGVKRKSKQQKSLKAAGGSGVGRKVLPVYEGEISYVRPRDAPLYGVVLPMGHGKTFLADREGWIDWDSLVGEATLARLMEEAQERLAQGDSFEDSMGKVRRVALDNLNSSRIASPTLILSSSPSFFKEAGIECVLSIVLDEEPFQKNIASRDGAEKIMAKLSREMVLDRGGAQMIHASSNEEVRIALYKAAGVLMVNVGAPKLVGDEYTLPPDVGGDEPLDLDSVIELYYEGRVSRELVDYQVHLNGLRTYRNFGFTLNDWAKVAASIGECSDVRIPDEPMGEWPVTLSRLCDKFDISQDPDAQAIVNAHTGDPEAFTLSLLLHWKLSGKDNDVNGRLLPLYYVRYSRWSRVLRRVREGVLGSGCYMDTMLTPAERETILSMSVLGCLTSTQLRRLVQDEQMGYPSQAPPKDMVTSVDRFEDRLSYEASVVTQEEMLRVRRILDKSGEKALTSIGLKLSGSEKPTRKEVLALQFGLQGTRKWEDDKKWRITIMLTMKKLAIKWFRASRYREEWYDLVNKILDAEVEWDDIISELAVRLALSETSSVGLDWEGRVVECLHHVIVMGWLGYKLDREIALADVVESGLSLKLIGVDESEAWKEVISLGAPKYMLQWLQSSFNVMQVAGDLLDWSSSCSGYIAELVHCGRWLYGLNEKDKIGLLINWVKRPVAHCDEGLRKDILGCFAKVWLRRRLTGNLASELDLLGKISRRDGGYGLEGFRGSVDSRDSGAWSGHRGTIRVKTSTFSTDTGDTRSLAQCLDGVTPSNKAVTSTSLARSGGMVVAVMQASDKKVLNEGTKTLEMLRSYRPGFYARVLGWTEEEDRIVMANEQRDVQQHEELVARAAALQMRAVELELGV